MDVPQGPPLNRHRLRRGRPDVVGRGADDPALGACSSTLATQPTTRLTANVGVNMSRGMPQISITTPA